MPHSTGTGSTAAGGTFESDTDGTYQSDTPGTFQTVTDGTFHSAMTGTFQSDTGGTSIPLLSISAALYTKPFGLTVLGHHWIHSNFIVLFSLGWRKLLVTRLSLIWKKLAGLQFLRRVRLPIPGLSSFLRVRLDVNRSLMK